MVLNLHHAPEAYFCGYTPQRLDVHDPANCVEDGSTVVSIEAVEAVEGTSTMAVLDTQRPRDARQQVLSENPERRQKRNAIVELDT